MSSKRKRSYDKMISYAPFWRTLHRKNLTQYDLVAHMSISSSMMQRQNTASGGNYQIRTNHYAFTAVPVNKSTCTT